MLPVRGGPYGHVYYAPLTSLRLAGIVGGMDTPGTLTTTTPTRAEVDARLVNKLWSIEKGAYDDNVVKGAFIGTRAEVDALIADLNRLDAANIHFTDDAYVAAEITPVRTAADILTN